MARACSGGSPLLLAINTEVDCCNGVAANSGSSGGDSDSSPNTLAAAAVVVVPWADHSSLTQQKRVACLVLTTASHGGMAV